MTELREVVHQLVARHGIPGAVVGVLEDGRVEAEAAGIANMNSGVEIYAGHAVPDRLDHQGWTTTLLLSLVEQGLVDLDAPVKRYLPDLVLGEHGVTDALVVRHLATYATGLDAAIRS